MGVVANLFTNHLTMNLLAHLVLMLLLHTLTLSRLLVTVHCSYLVERAVDSVLVVAVLFLQLLF